MKWGRFAGVAFLAAGLLGVPAFVLGPGALDPRSSWLPLVPGTAWTYRVVGTGDRVALEVGEPYPIDLERIDPGSDARCRASVHDLGPEWIAAPRPGGVLLAAVRGWGGGASAVPIGDLRWYEDEWRYWTIHGCTPCEVPCRRAGIERVVVPAGAWECLRLEVGPRTFWLAKGVGIVRWIDRDFVPERVLELESMR